MRRRLRYGALFESSQTERAESMLLKLACTIIGVIGVPPPSKTSITLMLDDNCPERCPMCPEDKTCHECGDLCPGPGLPTAAETSHTVLATTSLSSGGQKYALAAGGASGLYAQSVAADGDKVVLGEWAVNGYQGMASVFKISDGTKVVDLVPPKSGVLCGGYSVGISGDIVVVGAPCANSASGEAYVYDLAGACAGKTSCSVVKHTLTPTAPTGWTLTYAGWAVSILGVSVVITAPISDKGSTIDAGLAFHYCASSGNLLNTLKSDAASKNQNFGYSVAQNSDTLLLGAPCNEYPGNMGCTDTAGAVFEFGLDGVQKRKISSPDSRANSWFGSAVAIDPTADGSSAKRLIGANAHHLGYSHTNGNAYIFGATGTLEAWLTGDDSTTGGATFTGNHQGDKQFGSGVAIAGDVAVVGNPGMTWGGSNSDSPGKTHVFSVSAATAEYAQSSDKSATTTAAKQQTLEPTSGLPSSAAAKKKALCGFGVAITGSTVAVSCQQYGKGFTFDAPSGMSVGTSTAYTFPANTCPTPCNCCDQCVATTLLGQSSSCATNLLSTEASYKVCRDAVTFASLPSPDFLPSES